jgi:pilus assembly protein CpaB
MSLKTIIPFLIAIVLGVVAVKVGKDMLRKRPVSGPTRKFAAVVVAKGDLSPGSQIQAGDLGTSELPVESVPPGAIRNAADAVGRSAASAIHKGQTLVEPALAPRDWGMGLQALVPPGMRAATIEVNEVTGMTGLLSPGCYVDVLATLTNEAGIRRTVARTIVENVKVTAVGTEMAPKVAKEDVVRGERVRNVTLLVTPKQAEALELAATKARPRLVLRGKKDEAPTRTAGVTIAELVGVGPEWGAQELQRGKAAASFVVSLMEKLAAAQRMKQAAAVSAQQAKPAVIRRSVQLIKGGVESVKTFEMTEAQGSLLSAADGAASR